LLKKTLDSEAEALYAFQSKGDQKALAKLYKSYMPLVYGVCLKYLKGRDAAQDMVMNIYEKLVIKLADQRVDNFKSWLYVLTKNECLMQLRTVKRKNEAQSQDFSQVHMEFRLEEHHDDGLESDLTKMEACIEKLKNNQKLSIKLFYLEKKCYQEVAEATGEDLKKVKSHIQNGKRNLKICIEELREREA
jgi:RNA polymerase sigma factor (sigma-70 family)